MIHSLSAAHLPGSLLRRIVLSTSLELVIEVLRRYEEMPLWSFGLPHPVDSVLDMDVRRTWYVPLDLLQVRPRASRRTGAARREVLMRMPGLAGGTGGLGLAAPRTTRGSAMKTRVVRYAHRLVDSSYTAPGKQPRESR
jgi:hypothetical protein